MRVPFIVRWPGRFPAGRVIEEPASGVDLLPTILDFLGLPLPGDRVLDGESLRPWLTEEGPAGEGLAGDGPNGDAPPAHGPIWFHQLKRLEAVRDGDLKYHDRHGVFFGNPMDWPWGPMKQRGPWLFDLSLDPDESYDVTARYPNEAARLRRLMEERNRQMAANPRGWI